MTDLDWLATNVHEWPKQSTNDITIGIRGRPWDTHTEPDYIRYKDGTEVTKHQWQQRRKELQNKQSWDDAPEWANSRGQCSDGAWEWYEDECPPAGNEYWMHDLQGTRAGNGQVLGDWRDTLEKRPKKPMETLDALQDQFHQHFDDKKEFKPTHVVNDIPCTIAYQSKWVVVITTETGEDIAYGAASVTIEPYKTKREQKIDELLDLWRRQSLDAAHDNEDSTVKLGRAIEWFVDNYIEEDS